MNTEADIVERLRARYVHPHFYDGIFNEAAAEITKLRTERDDAATDMRERCAKAVETADRTGKRCLDLVKTMAGSEAMRRIIVEDIRGLSVIATQREGGAT